MVKLEDKVAELLQTTIEGLGYELYDVKYEKEGKEYYLRVYIDQEKGISLDDCETVSNAIDPVLDQADYIKEQYFLEVSSPGLERILRKDKHFADNRGKQVEAKLYKPVGGAKEYQGVLGEVNQETIQVGNIYLERSNIAIIKTIYDFQGMKEE